MARQCSKATPCVMGDRAWRACDWRRARGREDIKYFGGLTGVLKGYSTSNRSSPVIGTDTAPPLDRLRGGLRQFRMQYSSGVSLVNHKRTEGQREGETRARSLSRQTILPEMCKHFPEDNVKKASAMWGLYS